MSEEAEEKPLQTEEEMASELEWEDSKPGEVLEMQELSEEEEAAAAAAAARCNNGEAAQFPDDDIRVLFETPSGFAIFRYDGFKLGQPNALKEIWADFVDPELANEEVSILTVQTFKNKVHAISGTGVSEEFAAMIKDKVKPGQQLAVGNEVYKRIIENKLNIPCMYDPAVADLMWGLEIQMQSLLPSENSDRINEDCFPISKGMYYFLNEHKFDVKPDMMVTRHIIALAGLMYDCDCRVDGHRNTLRSVAEYIKRISGLNTQDWHAFKIVTALKIICCPEENITDAQLLFSTREMEKFKSDAPRYKMFLKAASLSLYDEVHYAWKLRSKAGQELSRLIKLAKKVDVEQPREAAIDQDDLDRKKICPGIDPAILDELIEYGTVISACRPERQVPPTDELERYTQISSHALHRMNKPGILSMDIHPLKDIVATGGMDTNAVLFDRLSGQILCTLTGHSKKITSLKFVNRDELIVTGSADKTVRIWKWSEDGNYSCIHTLKDHAAEAGVMEEMVNDAVDSALDSEDMEEEIEEEVDKVLASVAGETASQLPDAVRTQKIHQASTSKVPEERQAVAEGVDDDEEDLEEIRARLAKVRS